MKQGKFSRRLKIIIIGIAVMAVVVYFWVVPYFGRGIAEANPEYAAAYWPWVIFVTLTAVPIAICCVLAYRIADDIGKDKSFTEVNAKRLSVISTLAAVDGAYFWVGNLVMCFLNWSHPGVFLFCHFFVFLAAALSVAFAALAHLTHKAAGMEEEQELTI